MSSISAFYSTTVGVGAMEHSVGLSNQVLQSMRGESNSLSLTRVEAVRNGRYVGERWMAELLNGQWHGLMSSGDAFRAWRGIDSSTQHHPLLGVSCSSPCCGEIKAMASVVKMI